MKRRAWLAVVPIAVFAACGLAAAAGVRVNTTPSVPVGLWHLSKTGEGIFRGDTVEVCVPPWPNVVIGHGNCPFETMPLVKPVGAVAGDVVQVGPLGVAVNGHLVTGPVPPPETFAAPVARVPDGLYQVREGEAWILSDRHPRSFDSRYFGPVCLDRIRAKAAPLLVLP